MASQVGLFLAASDRQEQYFHLPVQPHKGKNTSLWGAYKSAATIFCQLEGPSAQPGNMAIAEELCFSERVTLLGAHRFCTLNTVFLYYFATVLLILPLETHSLPDLQSQATE